MSSFLHTFLNSILPVPQYTRLRNRKLYDWMNSNAPGKKVLNLGSGIGRFDKYLSKEIKTINLDIDNVKPNLHIVADAHNLPFKDGAFDIVYSIAVLEHVKKPWLVANEIYRILRNNGNIVVDLPFLNTVHNEHDFFRFTDKGIRALFDETRFISILEQVSAGGGSFLSVFFLFYFEQFVWAPLRPLFRFSCRYLFSLFKYLDIFINQSKTLRYTANSFTFIGMKI
jgi:ubiquinone/menaquinone biosynthesis C-methylase UbiE